MSALRALAPALLAALAAAPAAALGEHNLTAGDVQVTVHDPWPELLNRGHEPLLVRITNRDAREAEVEIRAERLGYGQVQFELSEVAVVAPGETAWVELFQPVDPSYPGAAQVSIRALGKRSSTYGVGASEQADPTVRSVLYVTSRSLVGGTDERWSQEISGILPPNLRANPGSPHAAALGIHVPGYVGPGSAPAPSTRAHASWAVKLAAAEPPLLPARVEPYTSLDAVVLDADGDAPAPAQLEAILQWTRLGGCLALVGERAPALAAKTEGIAAWTEPRFQLVFEGGATSYRMGQGTLLVADSGAGLDDPDLQARLGASIESSRSWIRGPGWAGTERLQPEIPGLELPLRFLTVLLFVFALVIGPLNLIVVRKLKRPVLILFTVPALAILFSLGVFLFGALAQGLGVRGASVSLAVLDERAHRASASEVRATFAGLSAGDGWSMGPGGACTAWLEALRWDDQRRHTIDLTEGVVMGGAYLPVRTPVRNLFLGDRASRGRLEIEERDGRLRVVNALGARVEALLLRDARGAHHELAAALEPGAEAELAPLPSSFDEVDTWKRLEVPIATALPWERLPRACYAARVGDAPWLDPCGVEQEDVGSQHVLLGVLPLAGGQR